MLALAITAKADLGDTYATSCQRYGGKGTVIKDTIAWERSGWLITEQFRNNQCVAIVYNAVGGGNFSEAAIWTFLSKNASHAQNWREYGDVTGRAFVTNDDRLYAKFWLCPSLNGQHMVLTLRIAYKSWMARNGMFNQPDESAPAPSKAPVEEGQI